MKQVSSFEYRKDIDGLRAIAVAMVVLYHLGLGVRGGFVGVDIFFVISGFLITSKILTSLELGEFKLKDFFWRRVKRLMPAVLVTILLTLGVGWFILLPHDFIKTAESSLAHLGLGSNIYFWQQSDYFGGGASDFLLLHTWSLSVEEQFYILMPLLLLLAYKMGLKYLKLAFVFSIIVSLSLCCYASYRYGTPNYYLLPFRWWEMALGGLLPVLKIPTIKKESVRNIVGGCSLVLMIFSAFIISENVRFPSEWALLPCLGALVFIWSGIGNSAVHSCLSVKPLVLVGAMSYSIYLLHWPIYKLVTYSTFGDSTSLIVRLLLIPVIFIASYLMWRFVEKRLLDKALTFRQVFLRVGVCALMIGAISGAAIYTGGYKNRLSAEALTIGKDSSNEVLKFISRGATSLTPQYHNIGELEKDENCEIFVWGDSHAAGIHLALNNEGFKGMSAIYAATAPLVEFRSAKKASATANAVPVRNGKVLAKILELKPKILVLAAKWNHYCGPEQLEDFEKAFGVTLKELDKHKINYVVLAQVPHQKFDVPKKVKYNTWKNSEEYDLVTKAEHFQSPQYLVFEKVGLSERLIDYSEKLLKEDGTYRFMKNPHELYYTDSHHLSARSSEHLAKFIVSQPLVK